MIGRAAVVLSALLACSCAASSPSPRPAARVYPGILHPPSQYPGDFVDEQRVTATYEGHSTTFDAVVQKRGDELTLLGRTPFGSRAFAVVQRGVDVELSTYVDRELPFPPRYILLDVHRTLLVGVAPHGAALADGSFTRETDDELVSETWEGGRLRERRFRRSSGEPPGEIVITYEGGMLPDGVPPRRMLFQNAWFGYRLEIVTTSHQAL